MYVATYSQEMKLFFIQKQNCNSYKLKKHFTQSGVPRGPRDTYKHVATCVRADMCHVCRHVLQEIKLFFIQKQDCNSHKLKNISQSGVSHGTGHTCHELALRHIWCEVFELTRATSRRNVSPRTPRK